MTLKGLLSISAIAAVFVTFLTVVFEGPGRSLGVPAPVKGGSEPVDTDSVVYHRCYERLVEDIKKSEGFKSGLYYCPGGCLTIGYGHVIKERDSGLTSITKAGADKMLRKDFNACIKLVMANTKLTKPNEVLAMAHFVYCLGIGTFLNSRLPKMLEDGKKIDNVLLSYCKYKGPDSVLKESRHIKMNRKIELYIFHLNTDSLVQSSLPK